MKTEITNKSSMLYWYPKIKGLPIPQPKTEIYMLKEGEFLEGDREIAPDSVFFNMEDKAKEIGFPLFLRTDFSSCKHSWKKTCYVECIENMPMNIIELMLNSAIQSFMSYSDNALVMREFIKMETAFTAFNGDFPVNKERRYFIKDGKVQCHHPYWYPAAIEGHTREENWKELTDKLNAEDEEEIEILTEYAELVGHVLHGYWSVDFAKGIDGTWYLIDMAEGQKSFHWLECEHCPQQMRDQYSR